MWKTQLSGLKKSSQCSYLGWFKARKNIPRSFQMNDLLPDPFSHGQTFLMPTARGDQGCCAGNVYLAGPEHFVCFQTGQDREQRTGSTGQRQLSPCAFSRAEQPALSLLLPGRPWLPGTTLAAVLSAGSNANQDGHNPSGATACEHSLSWHGIKHSQFVWNLLFI